MVGDVSAKLATVNCFVCNKIICDNAVGDISECSSVLHDAIKSILKLGLPLEYLLTKVYANSNLPDGAIKHIINT